VAIKPRQQATRNYNTHAFVAAECQLLYFPALEK
jgi:hypothetical protein